MAMLGMMGGINHMAMMGMMSGMGGLPGMNRMAAMGANAMANIPANNEPTNTNVNEVNFNKEANANEPTEEPNVVDNSIKQFKEFMSNIGTKTRNCNKTYKIQQQMNKEHQDYFLLKARVDEYEHYLKLVDQNLPSMPPKQRSVISIKKGAEGKKHEQSKAQESTEQSKAQESIQHSLFVAQPAEVSGEEEGINVRTWN
ncbi:hypothetical protein TrLO_g7590 [Triparma laevis f. longispina]|nr:hypothetical protein TrLO_g7590 [Triparma laevis f. longispina]